MSPRVMRIALVVLLLGGAYLAAQRWLSCVFPFGPGRWYPEMWGLCAFGSGSPEFDRYGPGPLWPGLVVAALYLVAAAYVLRARIRIAPDRMSD
jgi:hypothetical protein